MDERLAQVLQSFREGATPRPSTHLVERLERLHHSRFPDDLRAFLRLHDGFTMRDTDRRGVWQLLCGEESPGDLCTPAEGNLFEHVVAFDQQFYNGSFGIMQFAGRVLPLGVERGTGDLFFAALCGSNRIRVAILDHEEFLLTGFVANDLAELAALEEDAPLLEGDSAFLDEYARNLPLACLLSNHAQIGWRGTFEDAWDLWLEVEDPEPIAPTRMALDSAAAFHHLWHPFFFGDDAALAAAVQTCVTSASPLIRDMAALVRDLASGREQLGSITDVHEMRAWVQAHSL